MAEPLTVGCDCIGLGSALIALRQLSIPFTLVFASEIDTLCRDTLLSHASPQQFWHDIYSRADNEAPHVDLYITGFPCQAFSTMGNCEGFRAPAHVGPCIFFKCVAYIQSGMPKIFILENVKGLMTIQSGRCFRAVLEKLFSLKGYHICWRVLNTREHGVPQNRKRLFFVGVRVDCYTGQFSFPRCLPKCALDDFLDIRLGRPSWAQLPRPSTSVVYQNVVFLLKQLESQGHDPFAEPWVFPCDSSPSRSHAMLDCSPCLMRSRPRGHWLSHHGRRMSFIEIWRLQGFCPDTIPMRPALQLARQLGNSMSGNVLERLLCNVLPAAGLGRELFLVDRFAIRAAASVLQRPLSVAPSSDEEEL